MSELYKHKKEASNTSSLSQGRQVITYTVVMSLNDLQEQCGTVLHGLGEDLEQVAIVIKIH